MKNRYCESSEDAMPLYVSRRHLILASYGHFVWLQLWPQFLLALFASFILPQRLETTVFCFFFSHKLYIFVHQPQGEFCALFSKQCLQILFYLFLAKLFTYFSSSFSHSLNVAFEYFSQTLYRSRGAFLSRDIKISFISFETIKFFFKESPQTAQPPLYTTN